MSTGTDRRGARRLVGPLEVAALAFVAALSLVVAGCGSSGESTRGLPDIELDRLEGGTYAVAQTGTPRVLNLWATWCAPCRAELPVFDQAAAELESQGSTIEVVGVNVGDSPDDAAELIDELGLGFDQVLDPKAQIQRSLRITGLPATVFVDGGGSVLAIRSGELDRDELDALLDEHLGVSPFGG